MSKTNTVHHRRCDACGFRYELLERRRFNGSGYDEPTLHALTRGVADDCLDCPRCGSDLWHDVVGTPALVASKVDDQLPYLVRAPDVHENQLQQSHFPYFDAGLGMTLQSPEHREWAKTHHRDGSLRDEPLVWVGKELPFDPGGIVDREVAHTRLVNERYNAYRDEMLAQPDTRKAWHMVEQMTAARDFSALGVDDPNFFGPTSYPTQGEPVKQDLDGFLYQDSGWASDEPQPWVPTALYAAGHTPQAARLPDHFTDHPHLIEASP